MHIYEIHTWAWLDRLSRRYQRPITLATVPDEELKPFRQLDAVWLMGVWERSPRGRQVAWEHDGLQKDYRQALPDFQAEDVVGSPYSVRRYEVDTFMGGKEGLMRFRERLRAQGLKLILDYVPNHVALDHPWTFNKAAALVQGTTADLASQPQSFFRAGSYIFAHGRDPYFPAWTDTTQANAFSEAYRQASIETLLDIASRCDGVRCDMAMLMTNRIFSQTWDLAHVGIPPSTEYWEAVIPSVKARYPQFLFMAEVYWDMEYELQKQGFDYCYDKRLFDRLEHNNASAVREHLKADLGYQKRLIRFIENHDEPRAISSLGLEKSQLGALLVATLPGAKLWHEGQFMGHTVKLPVQMGRRPDENDHKGLHLFYQQLLEESRQTIYQKGEWCLRDVNRAWPENESNQHIIAYTWWHEDTRRLVTINYSEHRSQCRVPLPNFGLEGYTWHLVDLLNHNTYERVGDPMAHDGLYIDLEPWSAHLFSFAS